MEHILKTDRNAADVGLSWKLYFGDAIILLVAVHETVEKIPGAYFNLFKITGSVRFCVFLQDLAKCVNEYDKTALMLF